MNKKIDVEKTINLILEQEGTEKGIQLIRDIINSIAKKKRRTKKRTNTYDSIAREIYQFMACEKYSRANAIYKLSVDKDISESTVNNHLTKFDKLAKENDYMNFGYFVTLQIISENCKSSNTCDGNLCNEQNFNIVEEFGYKFDISDDNAIAYYLKYNLDKNKLSNKKWSNSKESKYNIFNI